MTPSYIDSGEQKAQLAPCDECGEEKPLAFLESIPRPDDDHSGPLGPVISQAPVCDTCRQLLGVGE